MVESYIEGTISVPQSSATVTGDGTTFNANMKGSVIQFGTSNDLPTGLDGLKPYSEQRTVVAINSSTELTLDAVVSNPHTAVKYRISDIVDGESGAMYEAFISLAELKLSQLMKDDQIPLRDRIYSDNLRLAMQADNRNFGDDRDRPFESIVHMRDYSTVTP